MYLVMCWFVCVWTALCCVMCRRMIEEGSKRGKALVEKRQLFMEMSECSRLHGRAPAALSALPRRARVILWVVWEIGGGGGGVASHVLHESSHSVLLRVFECAPRQRECVWESISVLINWKATWRVIFFFFIKPVCVSSCRSSELRRHQTVDLQDGLQTPLCAEEMQPWVHVEWCSDNSSDNALK